MKDDYFVGDIVEEEKQQYSHDNTTLATGEECEIGVEDDALPMSIEEIYQLNLQIRMLPQERLPRLLALIEKWENKKAENIDTYYKKLEVDIVDFKPATLRRLVLFVQNDDISSEFSVSSIPSESAESSISSFVYSPSSVDSSGSHSGLESSISSFVDSLSSVDSSGSHSGLESSISSFVDSLSSVDSSGSHSGLSEILMPPDGTTSGNEHNLAGEEYSMKLREFKDIQTRLSELRIKEAEMQKCYNKSEKDKQSIQSVGQIVGELLKKLSEEKFIVKIMNGPSCVVGCRDNINKELLKRGTRVALDLVTLTIMRMLPRKVDPLVYKMAHESPGKYTFKDVGGLTEQIRILREVVELPLVNPNLFKRVGITPPKGCLLYGPPGTGKTLLARAVASQLECNFLAVVCSAIVDKYSGESARMIREMFKYARDHQPCIVFMDEIDAIGSRRFSDGTSGDREIHRGLLELLNQLDGFDSLGKVKVIMATNRPDMLDPALMRPGRLDRKIEIALPNEQSRSEVLKIHANPITKHGYIDFEAVVKLSDGFSCADLRNVCTEAGLFAIRAEREYVIEVDFMRAVRRVSDAKKLETKIDYHPL